MTTAFIGMGSNLGDRVARLRAGLAALAARPEAALVAVSPVFETAPVGGPAQGDYLNAVSEVTWSGNARQLLDALLGVETEQGRVRGSEADAPRTLDLDLLLFDDQVIDEPGLVVPHPRMALRGFVLEPLARLAPMLRHPILGETIEVLAGRVRVPAEVRFHTDGSKLLR